jgi:hypothetical protein
MHRFVSRNILPAFALGAWIVVALAQNPAEKSSALVRENRFEGDVLVPMKAGAPKKMHVLLTNWGIHGTQKIERFPEQGFLVIQLHSGNVAVNINGKEEKHKGGDFWTVPAGASMSVQATSESAVMQTMVIKQAVGK